MNASATKRLTVSSGDSDRAAGGLGGLPPSHHHGSGRGRIDRPSRLLERGEPLSSSPMKEGLAPLLQTSSRGRGRPSLEPSHEGGETPPPNHPGPYGRGPCRGRGLSLSDYALYASPSGVKDCAAPPIFFRRPEADATKSAPPLAARRPRTAVPDPSGLQRGHLSVG